MNESIRRIALIVLASALAAAPAAAQTAVDRGGRNFFSRQQDVEMGREAAKDAEKQFPVLQDAEVQKYVADLGARLAEHAPGYDFPYTFKVVNVADINAFALPGGPIYINRGTIEQARSEGELVGVLAHEISHVDLRHGTRQVTKAYGAQIGLALLGGLIGSGETTRQIINTIGGFSLQSVMLKYSRTAETDSDILGSQIMMGAGYDPKDMATFFDLLAQQSTRRTAEFFSSHPAPERRRERIEKEAALLGKAPAPVSQDRFRAIQSRLRSMQAAPTMAELAQAAKTGSATPSGGSGTGTGSGGTGTGTAAQLPDRPGTVASPSRTLSWYDSPSRRYRIARPSDWQVVSEDQSNVTIAAPGGAWRSGQGVEVSHGILAGPYRVQARTSSLDVATDEFIGVVLRSGTYLEVVSGSRRPARVEGGDALVTMLLGTPPGSNRRERVMVVTTAAGGGELMTLLYVVPHDSPREYESLFEAVLRNLRVTRR